MPFCFCCLHTSQDTRSNYLGYHVTVPTTAGTGSETTGTAIFDYVPLHFKTGIAHRALKPLLGIVDPLNTRSMPTQVHTASGLDVLW